MATTINELATLDELLDMIGHCSPPEEAAYAREHLQEARTYLLGRMPLECECSLDLARRTLARLDRTKTRRKAQQILATLSGN